MGVLRACGRRGRRWLKCGARRIEEEGDLCVANNYPNEAAIRNLWCAVHSGALLVLVFGWFSTVVYAATTLDLSM